MHLRDAVASAAKRPEVRDAVARIYAALQVEIDARRPKCSMSGRCCRFDEFGHRLYVTTMELAVFLPSPREGRGQGEGGDAPAQRAPILQPKVSLLTRPLPSRGEGTCPFQLDGLCSVHTIRPFGCRVFFCDEASADWQHAQYERFHAEFKRLHEELDVPYRYLEWREALRELQIDSPPRERGVPHEHPRLSLPQLPL